MTELINNAKNRIFSDVNLDVFAGLITRAGSGVTPKQALPQLDVHGEQLPEFISEQKHLITFDEKHCKIICAYLGEFSLAGWIQNQPTGEFTDRELPARMRVLEPEEDILSFPEHIRNTLKGNGTKKYIVDANFKEDLRENRYLANKGENGRWVMVEKNVPVYFQEYNSNGVRLENPKPVTSQYFTYPYYKLAFINAIEVDEDNKNIKGTEGTYLIMDKITTTIPIFNKPEANAYGLKLAFSSFMSILTNPNYGIIEAGEVTKDGVPEGSCSISSKQVTKMRVVKADGTYSEILPINGFRVFKFNKKNKRTQANPENQAIELAKTIAKSSNDSAKVNIAARKISF